MTPAATGLGLGLGLVALAGALTRIRSLRGPVTRIRKHNAKHAGQIVDAASSVAANLAEGNRRRGRDRLHLFRIAAGSADETRVHLLVAAGWGWVDEQDVADALALLDRELRLLHGH